MCSVDVISLIIVIVVTMIIVITMTTVTMVQVMITILRRIRVILWLNREYYMGVRWCGISLQVFNSISSEWTQWKSEISRWTKEKKRNSISTSNHVLFCLWNKLYRPLLTRIGYFADEWRVANTSPYILQPKRVIDGKESDVLAADWWYQRHVESYRNFTRVQF